MKKKKTKWLECREVERRDGANNHYALFRAARKHTQDPDHSWQSILTELSKAHLGKSRRRYRDWMTGNTRSLVDGCRKADAASSSLHRVLQVNLLCLEKGQKYKLKCLCRSNRWQEHLSDLLKYPSHPNPTYPAVQYYAQTYYCSENEIANTIKCLKHNRVSGKDELPEEISKHMSSKLSQPFCSRDQRSHSSQIGFGSELGCINHIVNLCHQKPIAVCFIDLGAAFYSVECGSLFRRPW